MNRTADASDAASKRVEVSFSTRTIATIVAIGILIAISLVILDVLVAIGIALVLALALSPPVDALERRGMRRGVASVLVFAAAFAFVAAIIALIANTVYGEIRQFIDAVPGYVSDLQNNSELRHLIQDSSTVDSIKGRLESFAGDVPTTATSLLGAASDVFSSLLALVTLTFLSLYLLMELPRIRAGIASLMPPASADRFQSVADDVTRTVSMAMLGNVAISVIAGTVLGTAAWLLSIPYPVVLGIIVGLLDLVPNVGATIAGVILGLVGLTVDLGTAIAIVIVDIAYQQVENYLLQPGIMRQAVELSPFTTVAVVIIGAGLLGVVGAIIAVPVAGAIRVIAIDLTRGRRARMAALRRQPEASS